MTQASWAQLRPKPLKDWTLRSRLIVGLLGVLVVLCLLIGTFTGLALRSFLMGRLDSQLDTQNGRQQFAGGLNPGPRGNDSGPSAISCADSITEMVATVNYRRLLPGGSEDSTIGIQICSTGERIGAIQRQSGYQSIPALLPASVLAAFASVPTDGSAHTVNVPGYGPYRASARPTQFGDIYLTALPLSNVRATLVNLTAVITLVSLIGLVLAGFAGALIIRLALRPLRRVTSTASKVAEMPLDEGEVALAVRVPDPNPHTEVGQVGVALNRMLENISDALNARHRSETRVRQFVADASHELRTPLASIRGYAELTRRSREQAPPDIAHAMTRVESEANRMTTLVEDLLLLARLDAGRPLARDEVDLTRLTVDVLSDAHAAGPDHHWHLDLGEEPVAVVGDELRLQQVLVNILANARTHTPPGTDISISLSQQGDSAVLKVRDNGPGIPPALMPDIFERFSRGEESRSRSAGSTGLGLAIVAAVVAAHRGTITVRSVPSDTEFTVTLPIHGTGSTPAQSPASLAGHVLKV
jgi:two-component system OmpR family sensor kinase